MMPVAAAAPQTFPSDAEITEKLREIGLSDRVLISVDETCRLLACGRAHFYASLTNEGGPLRYIKLSERVGGVYATDIGKLLLERERHPPTIRRRDAQNGSAMPYTPKWLSLADVLQRVIAAEHTEQSAKTEICHAMADRAVAIRFTVAFDDRTYGGVTLGDANLVVPSHLKPDGIDWDNSRPHGLWSVGPAERYGNIVTTWDMRRRRYLRHHSTAITLIGGALETSVLLPARRSNPAGRR